MKRPGLIVSFFPDYPYFFSTKSKLSLEELEDVKKIPIHH
ncbi:MAG: hypothetical protein ANABAC_2600 [Anaerolineae bacterium]|nr:MAG: hypothetical protein ANABAC_2600 [Anaerolineae bacterium]